LNTWIKHEQHSTAHEPTTPKHGTARHGTKEHSNLEQRRTCGSRSISSPLGATLFLRSPLMSHTRTVWSRLADTIRSSLGWNIAHIT
jgi:hypothetical protein